MSLAGGIKQHGYQCGMIWGAALAAGAQAHRMFGQGPQAEARAIVASKKVVEAYRDQNDHINCLEITDIDKSSSTMKMVTFFLLKGGAIGCFRRSGKYAPVAFEVIKEALADDSVEVPAGPVSCASLVARKLGVSELHVGMAAGLAGGIGLCGGACGALGAAIWITGMDLKREQGVDNFWKDEAFNARFEDLLERFLKETEFEFECSSIAGRTFEDVGDHAAYLAEGGCSNLIEVLSAQPAEVSSAPPAP